MKSKGRKRRGPGASNSGIERPSRNDGGSPVGSGRISAPASRDDRKRTGAHRSHHKIKKKATTTRARVSKAIRGGRDQIGMAESERRGTRSASSAIIIKKSGSEGERGVQVVRSSWLTETRRRLMEVATAHLEN